MTEGLKERIQRLEHALAGAGERGDSLERELAQARAIAAKAGGEADEFLFLAPELIHDPLPRDRMRSAFAGPEFEALLEDIRANGQNDAVTLRRAGEGRFEIAAGRRRLEACRVLGRSVLARVRMLDDAAMLRIQFSENERREDISALERARWFAEVKGRLNVQAKEVAAQFGLDPSTLSLYLRLARFPTEIMDRLRDPRRLAMLRARRVMEALDADPLAFQRIIDTLDAQKNPDPDEQVDAMLRAAEGREVRRGAAPAGAPDRRHVVHDGQRIGTLTRNGGQWMFRFATSVPEEAVQAIIDRLPELMPPAPARGKQRSA
ncbi:ParB/RepB/Spo0J family partition protein (plasmid) [Roseomonas marmotae]|uniref:ParB/RepB/Spo0J family partition protein n=1 Tax=Roseomonas marmotae TaxID=2768161 RepID=A0ABS3KFG1_9PROT|nr:ParB/RepB/Spo0J family partition protein [Roseomonas marmotae]QTI82002.1 ParB/RepB/Spo0J family partition protein [Roseomonas marmotae]